MTSPALEPPFDLSRRLTGCNPYFAACGAALEADARTTSEVVAAWKAGLALACAALDWPSVTMVARAHAQGFSLALSAPLDQLYTATEVNEWALWAALHAAGIVLPAWPHAPGHPAAWDEASALHTLQQLAEAERDPALPALVEAAAEHGLGILIDDDEVSIGSGRQSKTWPRAALPDPAAVPWPELTDIPIALVTGSNGKTTTVRLLAALLRAHSRHVAISSTAGVFLDGQPVDQGDYSGPGGARLALRQADADVAILETARGGILRRGIAPTRADLAIVTNISDDHFGEYGVDNLDDLAWTKLAIAQVLDARGLLVINGDDALLMRHARHLHVPKALFALDADAPALQAHREKGGPTCGVRDGRLLLETAATSRDLGAVADMPLACGGAARYNIGNLAAAMLGARALGIPPEVMAEVAARFGAARADNPGRLERFRLGDLDVFLDFAHNPEGVRGLLEVAAAARQGPLAVTLGQAGNRDDAEIGALGAAVARFQPDRVIVKDIPKYFRGRAPGSIPALLRAALVAGGVSPERVTTAPDEVSAARELLAGAAPGSTLVLQMLGDEARAEVEALLDALVEAGWHAGQPLPPAASA